MRTELEFLQFIKSEIASAEYGEGLAFNLSVLNDDIEKHIKAIKEVGLLRNITVEGSNIKVFERDGRIIIDNNTIEKDGEDSEQHYD